MLTVTEHVRPRLPGTPSLHQGRLKLQAVSLSPALRVLTRLWISQPGNPLSKRWQKQIHECDTQISNRNIKHQIKAGGGFVGIYLIKAEVAYQRE